MPASWRRSPAQQVALTQPLPRFRWHGFWLNPRSPPQLSDPATPDNSMPSWMSLFYRCNANCATSSQKWRSRRRVGLRDRRPNRPDLAKLKCLSGFLFSVEGVPNLKVENVVVSLRPRGLPQNPPGRRGRLLHRHRHHRQGRQAAQLVVRRRN